MSKHVVFMLTSNLETHLIREALQQQLEGINVGLDVMFCNNPLEIQDHIVCGQCQLYITGLLNGHEGDTQSLTIEMMTLNPYIIPARFAMCPYPGPYKFHIKKGRVDSKDFANEAVRAVGRFIYEIQLTHAGADGRLPALANRWPAC